MEDIQNTKLVNDFVWTPSYIGVATLCLGLYQGELVTLLIIILALMATRFVLEFIYRLIFGARRLQLSTGIITFVCQIVTWVGIIYIVRNQ